MRPFVLTTPSSTLTLDRTREAAVTFTVTNQLHSRIAVQTAVVFTSEGIAVQQGGKPWATVAPQETELESGETLSIRVDLHLPRSLEDGSYQMRLVVADVTAPDTVYTESDTVRVSVTSRRRRIPWWLITAAGAILAIGGGIALWWSIPPAAPKTLDFELSSAEISVFNGGSAEVPLVLHRDDRLIGKTAVFTAQGLPPGVTMEKLRTKVDNVYLTFRAKEDAKAHEPKEVWIDAKVGGVDKRHTLMVEVRETTKLAASFTMEPHSGDKPLKVKFKDTSSGEISRREWDFGLEGQAPDQSADPEFTFEESGSHTVTLTVFGEGDQQHSLGRTVHVRDPIRPLTLDVTAEPATGKAPLEVQFLGNPSKEVGSWSYSFGNGEASTEENPRYTFGTPGKYQVTVNGKTSGPDKESAKKHLTVQVTGLRWNVDVEESYKSGLLVNLAARYSGQPVNPKVEWELLDGQVKGTKPNLKEEKIEFQYAEAGDYRVKVRVEDDYGNVQERTRTVSVKALAWAPAISERKAGMTVTLTGSVDGDGVTVDDDGWEWSFGNGKTASGKSAVVEYETPGVKPVTLTVTDSQGHVEQAEKNVEVVAVACAWTGGYFVSFGYDGDGAGLQGLWLHCDGKQLTRVREIGRGDETKPSGLEDDKVGCQPSPGTHWMSAGYDGGWASAVGATLECHNEIAQRLTWEGEVHRSDDRTFRGDSLVCGFRGKSRFITHGWDGGCAHMTGMIITCGHNGRITDFRYTVHPSCPKVK